MPSVGTIRSITRHLLLEEPARGFPLGDFLHSTPGQEQLMIDAVDDLKTFLIYIRDNQVSGELTGAQAQAALALAWALNASAGATVRE